MGGCKLGLQDARRLGPIPGLGARSAGPSGDARRQVLERDGGCDLVDVLAARPARPAKLFFDFSRVPAIHAGTIAPSWREDKKTGLQSFLRHVVLREAPFWPRVIAPEKLLGEARIGAIRENRAQSACSPDKSPL